MYINIKKTKHTHITVQKATLVTGKKIVDNTYAIMLYIKEVKKAHIFITINHLCRNLYCSLSNSNSNRP